MVFFVRNRVCHRSVITRASAAPGFSFSKAGNAAERKTRRFRKVFPAASDEYGKNAVNPREGTMKTINIPTRLTLLTMLALIVFLAGCARSHVPVPQKPAAYTQEKAQAADHWRDIAVDVAEKIRDALVERTDLTPRPVYVEPPNSRPFMLSFHQLLRSELVSRAIQVSEERENDTVVVEFDVLTVTHDPSRLRSGVYSVLADMGIGLGRLFSGSSASDNEIIVTIRMSYNNRYVVHRSYIRYVNDADWALYLSPESLNPAAGPARAVRVINR